jgi:hypothetical protein
MHPVAAAQKAASGPAPQRVASVEELSATAVDPSGPTPENVGRIDILIERWASAEEQEKLHAAAAGGAEKLLDALKTSTPRPSGVLLSPGVQGTGSRARERRRHALWFAHEGKTPTGRQVIIATDEHLGFGEGRGAARIVKNEFTVIDIRFGPDGNGVGKIGVGDQVVYNAKTKTIELANYDKEPARLIGVKSVKK